MQIREIDWGFNGTLTQRTSTDFIVIHHAAKSECTAEDVHTWHRQNEWLGISYHFFVAKDGKITRGRPEMAEGAHAVGYNDRSIGICLEGHFDFEEVPQAQREALIELLRYLQSIYTDARIVRHRDVNPTQCPGYKFDDNILLEAMLKKPEPEHWAEEHFKYLNENGIVIHEKRFEDIIKRGELLAVIARLHKKLKG